jgi:GntR family transcriptional regulator/MocR family aminotransferase
LHPCRDADFNFLTGADMIPTIHHTDKLLYEQIYEFYKAAILQKRLAYNQRLPSYRVLAKELGIANNTVLKAYEQLVLEGYVTNVFRKGLYRIGNCPLLTHCHPRIRNQKTKNDLQLTTLQYAWWMRVIFL